MHLCLSPREPTPDKGLRPSSIRAAAWNPRA
jgi:hypothetical protein